MNKPAVSVLMNCFNGELFLKEAIQSVINQSFRDWELIFWDNCSNDKSAEIFHSFSDNRLKYYLSKNHTQLGEARKRAYEQSNGTFIAILDTDDVWESTKLEKQITYFDDVKVGIVISNAYFFNEKGRKTLYGTKPPQGWVFKDLLENYFVCLVTLVFKRSFVEKLTHQFDPDFNFISDFDLVLRLSKISKLKYHNETLGGWRVHGGNDTFKSPYSFVEETNRWINKQLRLNVLDKEIHKTSLRKLINVNNRQIAIFELIKGKRINCIKKIIFQEHKTIKDYIIFLIAFFYVNRKIIKHFYYKRISLGLLN